MESLIPVVSVLFILSLACERMAELVKNLLSDLKVGRWQVAGNMTTKGLPDSAAEEARHYRILKWNLMCGFLTAVACHASMFDILENIDDPEKIFIWRELKFPSFLRFILGCFITGAFISLGSKFWHDLLDIILELKNGKKQLTAQAQGDFDSLTSERKTSLMKSAIQELKPEWKSNFKNYRGVGIGNKLTGEPGKWLDTGKSMLRFMVTEKQTGFAPNAPNKIPEFISYRGYNIPTDIIETGEAVSAAVSPGVNIGRDQKVRTGTYGALVSRGIGSNKKLYGVSCYHVLFGDEMSMSTFKITAGDAIARPDVFSPGNTTSATKLGTATDGVLNEYVDIGFFEAIPHVIDNDTLGLGKPRGIRHVEKDDENKLKVHFYGHISGKKSGTILTAFATREIKYQRTNGGPSFHHELNDLIEVELESAQGDSGAVVMTEDKNEIIGILVATATRTTYVIPVRSIENQSRYNFEI